MKLTVINNQYEDSVVQLVGEGYEDDITLDNIHSVLRTIDPEQEEGSMAEGDVSGNCLSVCLSICLSVYKDAMFGSIIVILNFRLLLPANAGAGR